MRQLPLPSAYQYIITNLMPCRLSTHRVSTQSRLSDRVRVVPPKHHQHRLQDVVLSDIGSVGVTEDRAFRNMIACLRLCTGVDSNMALLVVELWFSLLQTCWSSGTWESNGLTGRFAAWCSRAHGRVLLENDKRFPSSGNSACMHAQQGGW
jgi:hypothetical protein